MGQRYSGHIVNKYPGNPALRTTPTATTNYYHSPKMFRIAEMYLIAAEAALSHLNSLRVSRGLAALIGLSGVALFTEIKAERFRELAFEGFRFDDLKRWGEGFVRHSPQNLGMLQTGSNFISKSANVNDNKFVWAIPERDIIANPNIVQNPGW